MSFSVDTTSQEYQRRLTAIRAIKRMYRDDYMRTVSRLRKPRIRDLRQADPLFDEILKLSRMVTRAMEARGGADD